MYLPPSCHGPKIMETTCRPSPESRIFPQMGSDVPDDGNGNAVGPRDVSNGNSSTKQNLYVSYGVKSRKGVPFWGEFPITSSFSPADPPTGHQLSVAQVVDWLRNFEQSSSRRREVRN